MAVKKIRINENSAYASEFDYTVFSTLLTKIFDDRSPESMIARAIIVKFRDAIDWKYVNEIILKYMPELKDVLPQLNINSITI